MSKKISNAYRKSQLGTAGPGQRVVLMYDTLIRELNKSLVFLKEKGNPENIEEAHNSLVLGERVVLELKLALDMEQGGEISENLNNLYDFWIQHISEANSQKNTTHIKEIINMAEELRDAWKQAVAEQAGK